MKFVSNCIGLVFICVLTSSIGWPQAISTAQISGTVKDQSGAVLPGVEVTVTQMDTGLTRSVLTNETGFYTMPNLPIGPYRLEVSLPGFRTYVQTGIVLQVSANPVINAVLEIGQLAETVEVQANAALVETRSTGIGQVIDNQRVLELPLNGRQVTELVLLSGMATVRIDTGGLNPGTRNYPTTIISVAGGMVNGLTYLLDGGTHNDPWNNLNLPMPFPDALQEFRVETSALPAQYGHHSAAAVNAVTKAGTNEFHGDLFEFVRNGALNARNAFALTRDSLKRNQFGGVLGGPAIKNKLFFFGGYQGTVQRSAPTTAIQYVPTPAMLAGDFTAITSPACNGGRQITLRAPFVNNRISPSLLSTPALNLMRSGYIPETADPCGKVQFGRKRDEEENVFLGRVDYQFTSKHSLFGRYQQAGRHVASDYDGKNILTFTLPVLNQRTYSFVLGDTYLIGGGTVSSFRGTVLRTRIPKYPPEFFSLADLGVKNLYIAVPKFMRLNVTGGFGISQSAASGTDAVPTNYSSTVWQLAEDLSLVRGAHQVGFGTSYIHSMLTGISGLNAGGNMTFSGQTTGLGLADFMSGKAAAYTQGMYAVYYPRQNYMGTYLQDTWKVNSRLTVNAGIRWEPNMPAYEKWGHIVHFDRAAFDLGVRTKLYNNAPVGLLFPGDPGMPDTKFGLNSWRNVAPRLGIAWDPMGDGKWTIRSAYGIFFDLPNLQIYTGQQNAVPYGTVLTITNPDFADPWANYPGGNPFPFVYNADFRFPLTATVGNYPLHPRAPYAQQWNLNIQRQIGTDWLVTANYLGSHTLHLYGSKETNPANYIPGASCVIAGRTFSPCSTTANIPLRRTLYLQNPSQGQYYGAVHLLDDGGTASYHAAFFSVQRRAANGVTVQGNYTLSHCIGDPITVQLGLSGSSTSARPRQFERGNCDSDRRHLFNMSIVAETPQFSSRTMQVLASNWQVSGIVRAQTGEFLSVTSGIDTALTGQGSQRPNQILSNVFPGTKTAARWLDRTAFAQAPIGTFGNAGRNNVQGPGGLRIDIGLSRNFPIRERQSVQFRAEAFNLPNRVNLNNPTTNLNSATFGTIQAAQDPRIMQFALKYVF